MTSQKKPKATRRPDEITTGTRSPRSAEVLSLEDLTPRQVVKGGGKEKIVFGQEGRPKPPK